MLIYVVQPGDTVNSIARDFQLSISTIIYNNQLAYPFQLVVGQALLLSAEGEAARPVIETGGYAYPYASEEVLRQTLPYMTALNIFSYGFTTDGQLIPPAQGDDRLISLANDYGARPVMTLTPIDASGTFNNNLISGLVQNPDAVSRLIGEIVRYLEENGMQGVDVDFEYILPSDRVAFADFVRQLRIAVNAIGYRVSVALAPKTSDNQPGLLYEGKDYALLGAAADFVLLMTYEWGYTYSVPMAVAPVNKVRQVVEYALTRIPAEKIHLGIPNYGYDWPLPHVPGTTKATSIGNLQAIQIAIENNAEIRYDTTAQTPWFTYTRDGEQHEVWFEDVRSYQAKFGLISEYGLAGAGVWQLMRPNLPGWLLMSGTFWIR
ncbi:MAG: LysM peptidoglycan-binding domain-containing protein [Lachnospiraceae bacterium]|nr:LysM peptidoglycan-binding domain-containing protein [Lachnospiraceae bacterium]